MQKRPILIFAAIFASLIAKSTGVYNQTAKSVHPSTTVSLQPSTVSLQDSFPGPLMTGNRPYTVANTHSHNDYEQHPIFKTHGNRLYSSGLTSSTPIILRNSPPG